ncbi:MAG: RNA polymerase sigma factor [Armatimonadaceae bacterium]
MLADDEYTLVARAQRGDTRAFATLCERYRKRVWRVVASVTRGGADTDDLAQDALVRAFAALKSYRADAPFEAWLCRIALNAAHDFQRSAWRRRVMLWDFGGSQKDAQTEMPAGMPVGSLAFEPSPQKEAERRDVQRRVRKAVAGLKEKERVPIWLIYFEEFSLAEVARLEGVPESTVRSRVKAGLKRLEESLGDLNLSVEEDREPSLVFGSGGREVNHSDTLARQQASPVSSSAWKGCNV